ncbi:purine-cytosine permease family protein [Nonomuraea soli]|uniref:Purine-cytosine permease-like protein n=1 Tax=Nonomuraea soli TaxID=1032476 RepID=A0A7W0CCZ0_9ACTN|nr:cytosine permease [Nonomuraea soli]MBA2888870.1 purine-cytosine permease-like protein [Nonomuraea soli]
MEQRGIEPVPAEERYGRPRDLFFLWTGTTMGIFTLVYGTVLIAFGLSFPQAVAAIVVGNLLAFPLVGLTSLQGPATGTATMAVSRAAYGTKGARALSFFGWLNMVGFEAGGMVLITFASLTLLEQAGVATSTGVKIVVILVAAAIQLVLPLIGHAAVMKAQKYFTWVFVALFAVMAVIVTPKVTLQPSGGADFATFTMAVALVMSAGGLSWGPLGGDYSRYLPSGSSKKAVFGWAFLGGFLPYVLLMTLGAAVATVVAEAGDPISGLPSALPGWFVVPYLVLAIVTLFAVNTTDLYSSGLNLQAAGIKLKRSTAVVLDLVICVIITYVAVMSENFNSMLNTFLGLLIIWLAPWAGVYVTDWLRRGGVYDTGALFSAAEPYRWPALIAQAAGMVVAALSINSTLYAGPIATLLGGADVSIFLGLLVAGGLYAALDRRPVRVLEVAA